MPLSFRLMSCTGTLFDRGRTSSASSNRTARSASASSRTKTLVPRNRSLLTLRYQYLNADNSFYYDDMGQASLRPRGSSLSRAYPQSHRSHSPSPQAKRRSNHHTFFLSPVTSNDSTAVLDAENATLEDQKGFEYATFGGQKTPESATIVQRALAAASSSEPASLDAQLATIPSREPFLPLLSLPLEILHQIIEVVYYDDNTSSINANLENFSNTIPLLLRTLNQLSLRFLYKYAIFNRPHSFDKFLDNLAHQPELGEYVEFMDFQTFTSIGLGRTGRMNQEIQMVTANTIAHALGLCPNLIEFLASENIQDDMDVNVLDLLFNRLPKIQALDFCGASSESFVRAFHALVINENLLVCELDDNDDAVDVPNLHSLFKVSFHDCSNLTGDIFAKILPALVSVRRLDLTHTAITSYILNHHLPHSCRLTHLLVAKCSKLTTKDLMNFLIHHPAVANESLEWLNLQIDSNVVSPLSDVYLLFTLKHIKAPGLRYLNLGGLPINTAILAMIKVRFPLLESLTVSHSSVDIKDIIDFLKDNITLRHLDITGCKRISRWNITNLLQQSYHASLQSVEFDYKMLYEITAGEHVKIEPVMKSFTQDSSSTPPHIWKFYDNEGRRSWIYRIAQGDPSYKSLLNGTRHVEASSNLTYYDLETGAKMETTVKKPAFLKYASRKINCSIGYYQLNNAKKKKYIEGELLEDMWPAEFCQRGIYNYYSLNVK